MGFMHLASATSARYWCDFGKWTVHTPRSSRDEWCQVQQSACRRWYYPCLVVCVQVSVWRFSSLPEAREPKAGLIVLQMLSHLVPRPANISLGHYLIERIPGPACFYRLSCSYMSRQESRIGTNGAEVTHFNDASIHLKIHLRRLIHTSNSPLGVLWTLRTHPSTDQHLRSANLLATPGYPASLQPSR